MLASTTVYLFKQVYQSSISVCVVCPLKTEYSLLILPAQLLYVVIGTHRDVNRMNQLLAGPGPL